MFSLMGLRGSSLGVFFQRVFRAILDNLNASLGFGVEGN